MMLCAIPARRARAQFLSARRRCGFPRRLRKVDPISNRVLPFIPVRVCGTGVGDAELGMGPPSINVCTNELHDA